MTDGVPILNNVSCFSLAPELANISTALTSVEKQVLPLLCVKNYIGETALMQAARVPGPDAFRSIAKLLTIDQVIKQMVL